MHENPSLISCRMMLHEDHGDVETAEPVSNFVCEA